MYGAIEAGGTKFVCSVGDAQLQIIEQSTFPTVDPQTTMEQVIEFFKPYQDQLLAIGIGSFGPIDTRKESDTYGYITSTPKLLWQNYNFLGTMEEAFPQLPMFWTTDVNAAAYGEYHQGAGKGKANLVYVTIGTGVGGGVIVNHQFLNGLSHPEVGHTYVKRHPQDDYEGICAIHGDCLEGLVSGPSIKGRYGIEGQDLPQEHPYWDIAAYYIAQNAINLTLHYRPEMIIYGGGVMSQGHLLTKVRQEFERLHQGYTETPALEEYIVSPQLPGNSATIGCFALAMTMVEA